MKKSKFKSQINEAFKTYLVEEYKQKKEDNKSLFEKCITKNRFGILIEQEGADDMGFEDDVGDDTGFEDDVGMGGEPEEVVQPEIATDKPYPDLAWIAWQALITDPDTLEGNEIYEEVKRIMGNADGPMAIAPTDQERVATGLKIFTQLERIFQQNRI
jgi:hypothetical protein